MGMGLLVSVVFTGLADFTNHDACVSYCYGALAGPFDRNLFRGLLSGWDCPHGLFDFSWVDRFGFSNAEFLGVWGCAVIGADGCWRCDW